MDMVSSSQAVVHHNDLNMDGFRHLMPGEEVEFEAEQGEKGLKAVRVDLISERDESPRQRRDNRRYDDRRDRHHDNRHRHDREHRSDHGNGSDVKYLKSKINKLEGIVNRLLDALGDGNDPYFESDEIEEIRTGRRQAVAS